jgi:hypothetical protein
MHDLGIFLGGTRTDTIFYCTYHLSLYASNNHATGKSPPEDDFLMQKGCYRRHDWSFAAPVCAIVCARNMDEAAFLKKLAE